MVPSWYPLFDANTVQGRETPPETVSGHDPEDLLGVVAECVRRARRDEPGVPGLVAAATALAERWERCRLTTLAAGVALDEARAAEDRAHLDARSVVAVLESMLTGASPLVADGPHPAPVAHQFAAFLLGLFEVHVNARQLDTASNTKACRVLRYLVANRHKPVPRDRLIDVFWPDVDLDTGRRNLHQAVYVIRKTLSRSGDGRAAIVFEHDAYAVNRQVGWWCDIDAFDHEVSLGQRAESDGRGGDAERHYGRALELYRGEFLEDTPYEDWALPLREHYRLVFLDTSRRAADLAFARGDLSLALATAQRTLRREPADEALHRLAMRVHAAMGQQSLLARQYRSCIAALDAYDAAPSGDTASLYAELRA